MKDISEQGGLQLVVDLCGFFPHRKKRGYRMRERVALPYCGLCASVFVDVEKRFADMQGIPENKYAEEIVNTKNAN
jgi:hypothetical protein